MSWVETCPIDVFGVFLHPLTQPAGRGSVILKPPVTVLPLKYAIIALKNSGDIYGFPVNSNVTPVLTLPE